VNCYVHFFNQFLWRFSAAIIGSLQRSLYCSSATPANLVLTFVVNPWDLYCWGYHFPSAFQLSFNGLTVSCCMTVFVLKISQTTSGHADCKT